MRRQYVKNKAMGMLPRELRTAAEILLAHQPASDASGHPDEELLHELQVHQVELELQREALIYANASLEESRDRLIDFYEFSPVGYLTITDQGLIAEINQTGAALLGVERKSCLLQRFVRFVKPEDADRWHLHSVGALKTDEKRTCELALLHEDGSDVHVRLDSLRLVKNAQALALRVVLIDVTEKKRVEIALYESEERYRTAFLTSPDAVNINRLADGLYLDINEGFCRLLGWTREEAIGRTDKEIGIWKDMNDRQRFMQAMQRDGYSENLEASLVAKDGRVMTALISAHLMHLNGMQCILSVARDITERKLAEQHLRVAAATFESQEGMFVTDAARVILRVNSAFTEITGYAAEDACGQTPSLLKPDRHDAAFHAAMTQCVERSGSWQGEVWCRRKNGEVYPAWLMISAVKDNAGGVTNYVGSFSDITSKKAAEDKINNLAYYDPLTGLPNRRLLVRRLKHAMASGSRSARHGALLYLDLDNFKTLNDTRGHDVGDLLLQHVAQRLLSCVREADTVARFGGDEFLVLLEGLSEDALEAATQTENASDKIIDLFTQPYQLGSHQYRGTVSIGITLFSDQQDSIDDLLKRADIAMYQAKSAGRNSSRFFDPEMQAAVTARAALEIDLRAAVAECQFHLYYQVQVDGVGHITGAEALLRWQHPQRGLLSPLEFIPMAEENGLIFPLGFWVLETACLQLSAWATKPEMAHLTMAVNVSARQLHHRDFVEQVLTVLGYTGANPKRLKLELTESLLVNDVEGVIAKMASLKAKGVGFSLDDFGTGYSSLAYLKRLPLDQLKIDQSFVEDILTDPNDAAIAQMILVLAKSLGLAVIAEGVETNAQRNFLARQGCYAYQGFLFSKPLPIKEFEEFVRSVEERLSGSSFSNPLIE